MKAQRQTLAVAMIIAVTVALAGCSLLQSTTSPTPTAVDITTHIGEVIDPVGTVWNGMDSGGDDTTFTLHDDGTVGVQYGESSYHDPSDTWEVAAGVLYIDVFLDDMNGVATYVGTWDPETSTIDTTMTTTKSDRSLTVTLEQQ